jgi:general secretion pathway protein C
VTRFRISANRPSAAGLAAALMVIACGTTAAWWAVRIAAPRQAIAPAIEPTLIQPDAASALALFGTVGRTASGAATEQRLGSVRVVGVIVHPQRGSALISVNGGAPRAFAVGDTVSPGLSLREVNPDGAVFERFGERIELAAPRRGSADVLNRGASSP